MMISCRWWPPLGCNFSSGQVLPHLDVPSIKVPCQGLFGHDNKAPRITIAGAPQTLLPRWDGDWWATVQPRQLKFLGSCSWMMRRWNRRWTGCLGRHLYLTVVMKKELNHVAKLSIYCSVDGYEVCVVTKTAKMRLDECLGFSLETAWGARSRVAAPRRWKELIEMVSDQGAFGRCAGHIHSGEGPVDPRRKCCWMFNLFHTLTIYFISALLWDRTINKWIPRQKTPLLVALNAIVLNFVVGTEGIRLITRRLKSE